MMMKRQKLLTFFINCLLCVSRPLCAETITYDFSSPDYWVTELNGNTNPIKGTAFKKIYYKGNNHCFEGANDVYFYDLGGLMLKPEASLKLPFNDDWTINKVTIHSHSKASTSVKVNIFKSTDPTDYVSNSLTWKSQDQDYVYEIFSSYRKSSLYIMTANSNNARIASVSIEYTSASASFVAAPTFNPDSQTFSTESLDVTITAAEGCEVYYTIDGTIPSYTNAEEYIGTKGNNVTISASDSPITLKAIAVNPNTNKCSNVSSATYTYSSTTEEEPETPGNEPDSPEEEPDTPIINNGSKESPYTVAEVKALEGGKKEDNTAEIIIS